MSELVPLSLDQGLEHVYPCPIQNTEIPFENTFAFILLGNM